MKTFQLKGRKSADRPDRKSKLEFLYFKAVCFRRPHSDLFRTRSFVSRVQDECVCVPVGGLDASELQVALFTSSLFHVALK